MKKRLRLTEAQLVLVIKKILSEQTKQNDEQVKVEMEKKFPCLKYGYEKVYFREGDRMVAFDGHEEPWYKIRYMDDGTYINEVTGQKSTFKCDGDETISDIWDTNSVYTKKSPLNVRKGPSTQYPVIGKLNPQTRIYTRCGDWRTGKEFSHRFCEYTDDPTNTNPKGWVYGKYVNNPWDWK